MTICQTGVILSNRFVTERVIPLNLLKSVASSCKVIVITIFIASFASLPNFVSQAGGASLPLISGTIKINNGAAYTNSKLVNLTLSAQDVPGGKGISQMKFSNNGKTWSRPQAYAVNITWTLASGDGTKTVCVMFKNIAGTWSPSFSSAIVLDTTNPSVTITTPQNGATITG